MVVGGNVVGHARLHPVRTPPYVAPDIVGKADIVRIVLRSDSRLRLLKIGHVGLDASHLGGGGLIPPDSDGDR